MQSRARTVSGGAAGGMFRSALLLAIAVATVAVTSADDTIDLGGGLKFRGTVAGIAVGAVVSAILLVWLLIWCLCLRRRRTWDSTYMTEMLTDQEQVKDSYTSPSLAGGPGFDAQSEQQHSQSSIAPLASTPLVTNNRPSASSISDGRQSRSSIPRAGRMKDKLLEVSRSARVVSVVSELEMNAFSILEDAPPLTFTGLSTERLSKDAQLMKWLDSSGPDSAVDPIISMDLPPRHPLATLAALPFSAVRNLISRLPAPESDRLPLLSHLARSDPAGVKYDKLPAGTAMTQASPSHASLGLNTLSPRSMLTPRGTSLSQHRSSSITKRSSPNPDGDILGGNTHTSRHTVARTFTTLSATNVMVEEEDDEDDSIPAPPMQMNGQGVDLSRVSLRSFNPLLANRDSGIVFDSVPLGGLSFNARISQSLEPKGMAEGIAVAGSQRQQPQEQQASVSIHIMEQPANRFPSIPAVVVVEEQPYLNSVLTSMVRDTSTAAIQSGGDLSSKPSISRWALNPHQVHHQHVLLPTPQSPHTAAASAPVQHALPLIPTPPESSQKVTPTPPHQTILINDRIMPSSSSNLGLAPQPQQQQQQQQHTEEVRQQSSLSINECTDSIISSTKECTDSTSSTLLKMPHMLPSLLPSQAMQQDTQTAASVMSQFESPRQPGLSARSEGADPTSPSSGSPFLPLPSAAVMPMFSPLASSFSVPIIAASADSAGTVSTAVTECAE